MNLTSNKDVDFYTSTGVWSDTTLVDIFLQNVKKHPQRIALVDPSNKPELVGAPMQRISYADLGLKVDALATAFLAQGITKDDIVIVQLPNINELAIIYMALARIGAIFSPLPIQWREKEFNYICDLAKAKAYISLEDFSGFNNLEMVRNIVDKHDSLEHIISLAEVNKLSEGAVDLAQLNAIELDANEVFSLCWSSGTESNPKGCPMSHNNWIVQIQVLEKSLGDWHNRCQITQCTAPMVNMTGVAMGLINWLYFGGTTVFHHPFNSDVFFEQMKDEGITTTLLVPALLNMILKHPDVDKLDLSSVESILSGSAPPSAWALDEFKKRWNIDVSCAWGQTEGTAIVSSARDVPDAQKRSRCYPNWSVRSAENPVKGIALKVVDLDSGESLTEVGDIGQLAYKGPNVFPGYFRRADISETSFDNEGYFYTGDLFRIEEDGFVSFFDRCKDIIIRGGNNISAQEVENVLQGHPDVMDVAAVAMPDERLGEGICVYVVAKDVQTVPSLLSLTDYMREQKIAVYKLPERLEICDAIPRNPVGKIIKNSLRDDVTEKLKNEGKLKAEVLA
ncbi:MAG: class I adenylate-forming enzyme family protein [Cycloclasticus sp.]